MSLSGIFDPVVRAYFENKYANSGGGTGGGCVPVVEKDVNFYDYDGTLLYSYTLAEAQALTELPPGPIWHEGLVFDGWNWTLEGVNGLSSPMTIGALYDTDDGATRIYISIPEAMPTPFTLPLCFYQRIPNGVELDWGDGSETEAVATVGEVETSHSYADPGDYVIRLMPVGKYTFGLGKNDANYTLFGERLGDTNRYIRNIARKVELCGSVATVYQRCFDAFSRTETISFPNSNISFGAFCFSGCQSLKFATLPLQTTSIPMYMFNMCCGARTLAISENCVAYTEGALSNMYVIERLDFPEDATVGGYELLRNDYNLQTINSREGVNPTGMFIRNCRVLSGVKLSDTVTEIPTSFAQECFSLLEIEIPALVTSIAASAFYNCYGLRRMAFLPATPPTVANANAFTGIPTDCVVEVPAGSLTAYQEATNYASLAAQMVEV